MRTSRIILAGLVASFSGCGDDSGSSPGDGAQGGDGTLGDGAGQVDGGGTPDGALAECDPVTGTPDLELEMVQGGFDRPVLLTSPPGDERLFVVEQAGTIEIVGGGTFLDITGLARCCGEEGLLGLAFHPDYATNRRFFVHYIDNSGNIQLDEYTTMSGNPNLADDASRRAILGIPHVLDTQADAGNHNGGMIAFGPDGYLYISTGDGGFQDDPDENGQATDTLLGKLLRIDIDATSGSNNYAIPAGNPLGDEIWAVGLRNPWRFSFDRMTGDIYIGDVGQGSWEEIDVAPNAMAGLNFGWDIYEGETCFNDGYGADGPCTDPPTLDTAKEFPITVVATGGGGSGDDRNRAIIGGYVYRGCKMPDYHGTYFYGTLNGIVRSLEYSSGGATNERDWASLEIMAGGDRLSAFGEDSAGEIYALALDEGVVYRIVPASP
jgi:glucose/arabinose dehydrogenase